MIIKNDEKIQTFISSYHPVYCTTEYLLKQQHRNISNSGGVYSDSFFLQLYSSSLRLSSSSFFYLRCFSVSVSKGMQKCGSRRNIKSITETKQATPLHSTKVGHEKMNNLNIHHYYANNCTQICVRIMRYSCGLTGNAINFIIMR